MADASTLARALSRRIVKIADPSIRVRYLQSQVRKLPPEAVADVVTVAMHGAEARDGDLGALLLALCLALGQEDSAKVRERIVLAALKQGQNDTATLLQPRPAERETLEAPNVPDFGRGRSLTLGERKSLARTRNRDLLARVLRDPEPSVIRILLGNPTLTELDVVRLCSRRPIPSEVLREVFRATKWIVRYDVRKAIVRNPFAPVDMALQLAAHLTGPDAKTIAASPELSPPLRETCRRVAGLQTYH